VRVLATTNRDLRQSVEKGDFREDLYYRLNVFPVFVPPLRERDGDIPILAKHFLKNFSRQYTRPDLQLSPRCLEILESHRWPGNVRELQNTIERAVIMSEPGHPLNPSLLGLYEVQNASSPKVCEPQVPTIDLPEDQLPRPTKVQNGTQAPIRPLANHASKEPVALADIEKEHILHVLETCVGNRTRAAEALGISIRTLRNKLNEYRTG
jgi:transcriptional regulator with PAS, ATPase and Fis domain